MDKIMDCLPPSREAEIRTYEDLVEYFKRSEAAKQKTTSYRNNVSTLTSFLTFCKVEMIAEPGAEFGADYEGKVSEYLRTFDNKGTRDNNKSRLKTLKALWDVICRSRTQSSFSVFHDAFSHYFNLAKTRDSKLNLTSLANKLDCNRHTLGAFALHVVQPRHGSLNLISSLEKELGTPKGALTLFVQSSENSPLSRTISDRNLTAYDNKICELIRKPYLLKDQEITDDLRNDFQSFLDFKTDITVRPLERNELWKLTPSDKFNSAVEWPRRYCSTRDEKHYAPTGLKTFVLATRFFGALNKLVDADGNHLYVPKDFRFVWLADATLVKLAIKFFFERMGQYTAAATGLINLSIGLLLPKFGYVRQHRVLGSQLPTPVLDNDGDDEDACLLRWEQWCNVQLKELRGFLEDLKKGNHIKRVRDPRLRIKEILERDHPISVLLELQKNMREFIDTHPLLPEASRIGLERDYLLVRMITVQPLRINMFKIMTRRTDNSGNLYRRADGIWAIRFEPHDFKNQNGAASENPYDVPFQDENIGKDIEHFFDHIRSKFNDDSDKVFVASDMGQKVKGRLNANLSNRFMLCTRLFLKDSPGFGPHACRHIEVTDFLKSNPGQFQVAANMIHDQVETVIKDYKHLTVADGHKFYQEYLAGLQARLVEKQFLGKPELIQTILTILNNNKNNMMGICLTQTTTRSSISL